MLDRGKLIVGTGSTNPPWHFEDDQGKLTGMDIAMARILAKGLFDDETKVEYVQQDANARIPNITTGKVDVVIQFMTISPARAQLVAFSRPYYVEGAALMTAPKSKYQTYKDMKAAGKQVNASVLQNVDADTLVHNAPAGRPGDAARQPGQRDAGGHAGAGRGGWSMRPPQGW